MLARIHSAAMVGIKAVPCEVEVDVGRGGFERSTIVGLPDAAVKESVERVKSAITNCGYPYPRIASIINLAPADINIVGERSSRRTCTATLAGNPTIELRNLGRARIIVAR